MSWSIDADVTQDLLEAGADPGRQLLILAGAGNYDKRSWEPPKPSQELAWEIMLVQGGWIDRTQPAFDQPGQDRAPWTYPSITAPACNWYYNSVSSGGTGNPHGNYANMASRSGTICPESSFSEYLDAYVEKSYSMGLGSSLSAPIAAGVAALMLEVNPDLQASELRFLLEQTADPFLRYEDGSLPATPDDHFRDFGREGGHGYLNASHAVAAAHYLALFPDASLEEAVRCGHLDEVDGTPWLNPRGRCLQAAEGSSRPSDASADPVPASSTEGGDVDQESDSRSEPASEAGPTPEVGRTIPFGGPVVSLLCALLALAWVRHRTQP